MNILQVTLGFLPADAWGGPVKIVYENSKELIVRGHRVTVYCTNMLDKKNKIKPHTFEKTIDGIRVVYFNAWHIPQWPGTLGPIWLPDLKAYLLRELKNYDIIHLNGYRNLMNLQITTFINDNITPLVMQPHGTMPIIVNSFLVKRLYDRLLGRKELDKVQAFIAGQEAEKRQIISHSVPPERIEVISNGLNVDESLRDTSKIHFRERFGIPVDKPMILFLGRINRKKGVDMLIHAFAQMKGSEAHLTIAGPDDGQLSEVKSLVEQYNLEKKVTFTGLLSGPMIWAAYGDADLFVLPCRTDTFPMAIIEACATGTPMVIAEGCEMVHLVRDKVAEVAPFEARAFAQSMQGLLEDRDKYQHYRENCEELMRTTFSIQASVDRLEALYRRVSDTNQSNLN